MIVRLKMHHVFLKHTQFLLKIAKITKVARANTTPKIPQPNMLSKRSIVSPENNPWESQKVKEDVLMECSTEDSAPKRGRGRPKGSKNKPKI